MQSWMSRDQRVLQGSCLPKAIEKETLKDGKQGNLSLSDQEEMILESSPGTLLLSQHSPRLEKSKFC